MTLYPRCTVICLVFIPIDDARAYIGVVDVELIAELNGNDDGDINPGETVALRLSAFNFSVNVPAREVVVRVYSISPLVSFERTVLTFGDIPANRERTSRDSLIMTLSTLTEDGDDLSIFIEFGTGDVTFI